MKKNKIYIQLRFHLYKKRDFNLRKVNLQRKRKKKKKRNYLIDMTLNYSL